MSTERYDVLVIGFVTEVEDLMRPFEVKVPERSHMEDRFDPHTGEKLPKQVRVVDAEETVEYEVDKKRFKDEDEVIDYLCKKVGAVWQWIHDDGESRVIGLEAACLKKKGSVALDPKLMARVCEDSRQIRVLFKKNWGIDLGDAKIQTVETWG